jgi:ABC-type multidrug transport system fused ATPase/permease subunit
MFQTIFKEFLSEHPYLISGFLITILAIYFLQHIILSLHLTSLYAAVIKRNPIKRIAMIVGIILFAVVILNIIKNHIEMQFIPSLNSHIRSNLYNKTIYHHEHSIHTIELGKYIQNTNDMTEYMKYLSMRFFNDILKNVMIPFVIIAYLCVKYPKIGFPFLGSYLILILLCYCVKDIIQANKVKEDAFSKVVEDMHQSLFNLENIYVNNQGNEEMKKNDKKLQDYSNLSKECYQKANRFFVAYMIVLFASMIGLFYISQKHYKGETLVFIFILLFLYFNSMLAFGTIFFEVSQKLGELLSKNEFFERLFATTTSKSKQGMKQLKTMNHIQFDRITFSYKPKGVDPVFRNFSLDIQPGSHVVIMGTSGRGKTTLMKLLLKFYPVQEGIIRVNGVPINEIETRQLREKILYVNQKTSLFDETILYNLQYGNNVSEDTIRRLLREYDLSPMLEGKLERKVGSFGNQMSLGMQKVILLVRGLLRTTYDTIILDEPTASLDEQTKEKVMRMIQEKTKGKTVILITHDPYVLSFGYRVVKL